MEHGYFASWCKLAVLWLVGVVAMSLYGCIPLGFVLRNNIVPHSHACTHTCTLKYDSTTNWNHNYCTIDCINSLVNFIGGSRHKTCTEASKHYCEQSYNKDRGGPIKSRWFICEFMTFMYSPRIHNYSLRNLIWVMILYASTKSIHKKEDKRLSNCRKAVY